MRTLLLSVLLVLVPPALAGDIYRTWDDDGNPVFTDQPPYEGATPIERGEVTVTPSEEVRPRERETEPETNDVDDPPYESIHVVFPPPEEATRRVTGEVPVRAELSPSGTNLRSGDRMRVWIDGRETGSGRSLEVTVGPLDPGPHDVHVDIVDEAGETLVESEPFRFYLLRQSVAQ